MPTTSLADCFTTLSPEILKKAKEELGEDDNLRVSSITAIRQWIKKQPHLKSACTGDYSLNVEWSHLLQFQCSFIK